MSAEAFALAGMFAGFVLFLLLIHGVVSLWARAHGWDEEGWW